MSLRITRALFVYALAALVAAVAIHQQAQPALASDCLAVDQAGLPRDCTFLEAYGECIYNAVDSLDTCLDAASGWFSTGMCWLGYEVDFYACLPSEILEALIP